MRETLALKGKRKMKKEMKKKKHFKVNKVSLQLYIMAAFAMISVFVFNYLPMGGVVLAFKNYKYSKGIFGSDWVWFKNFEYFFKSSDFAVITRNTLLLNAVFIITGTVAALFVAVMLYYVTSRTKTKIFQTILITPHFLSWVVVAYMVFALLNPSYGLLNSILTKFGIGNIDWYSKPEAWPVILTLFSIWKHVGMDSVVYYAALMGIDSSMIEASEVDGANNFQKTIYVILPTLIPLITILTILKIGNIFRADFGLFYQLTRDVGALYPTTDVIDTYIFRTMRVVGDMGMGAAVGLVQSLVGFVLVIVTNGFARRIDPDVALF